MSKTIKNSITFIMKLAVLLLIIGFVTVSSYSVLPALTAAPSCVAKNIIKDGPQGDHDNQQLGRADFFRSFTRRAAGTTAALFGVASVVSLPSKEAEAAGLADSIDSFKSDAKTMKKAVAKETKKVQKDIKKEVKVLKKEAKKVDKKVTKEVKKMDRTIQKEAKKLDRAVTKGTQTIQRKVEEGTEVAKRESQKKLPPKSTGAGSPGGGGGGIDVSKLKVCDGVKVKCL